MTLIGLGGAARAGKDAFASILARDYGFVVMGMSDVLRDALITLDPLVPVDSSVRLPGGDRIGPQLMRMSSLLNLVDYTTAKTIPEVRRLLQVLGTDVVRKVVDEDAWVNAMSKRILEHYRGDVAAQNVTKIVVTGIRFDNELDMISELGGVSVYISRHKAMQEAPKHASEIGVLAGDFDRRLDNNGTLAALEHHAHALMAELCILNVSQV